MTATITTVVSAQAARRTWRDIIGRHWHHDIASFLRGLVLTALLVLSGPSRVWADDVSVWIYHNYPPFIIDIAEERGLSYDLARLLTDASDGAFQFNVMVLPRQRLNQRLGAGQPGLVMWVNPAWFGDTERTAFRWTDSILSDRNVVISPMEAPFEYHGPRSLTGMTLVGVRGHRYQDVDGLVGDGLVERVDLRSERNLVQFIASNRGRVAIVADSAVQYFVQDLALGDAVHVAEQPHSQYQRYILVQPQLSAAHDFLEEAVPVIMASPAWADVVERYGLTVFAAP
ncbi:transporter substrate-binding domain-containing protein [Tateyamaria omphalii]|uniref:Uncharacterized protein n=1 Tax=Tateyamaria omphalii TaxID=299262 RepID=A0A1P8MUM7_9RHOB|nr:transporter substrate-binding domain-containing protein [Tateyamaria omphalii]APX11796.1 hypothetical protein BWR18_08950 [Tateyamaria omphalii]